MYEWSASAADARKKLRAAAAVILIIFTILGLPVRLPKFGAIPSRDQVRELQRG